MSMMRYIPPKVTARLGAVASERIEALPGAAPASRTPSVSFMKAPQIPSLRCGSNRNLVLCSAEVQENSRW